MLKKLIALNKSDFWLLWGVTGGVFLLIQIVEGVVLAIAKEDTTVMLSGALLPCLLGFFMIFTTVAQITVTFEQAVQFGCTRKRALWLSLGLSAAEVAGAMAFAAVLSGLERLTAPTLWRMMTGAERAAIVSELPRTPEHLAGLEPARVDTLYISDFALAWYWWLAIAAAVLALGLIFGALLQRYGRQGFWALWVIWMGACFLPQMLPSRLHAFDWLFPLVWIILGAAVVLGLIWSVWSLLHAQIRS